MCVITPTLPAQPPAKTEAIELADLPDPPDEIAALIKNGKVTMSSGRKPWEEVRDARDRTGVSGSGLRLAAETKFTLNYDYRSRMRWRSQDNADGQLVTINITYTRAKLIHDHKIWFRRRPHEERFWDDRIVRHEFDHVRLSSNPLIAKRFLEKLRETRTLRKQVGGNIQLDEKVVRGLVNEHVQSVFDEIVDLVGIRYKELDRETRHGLKPIQDDSEILDWMNARES